MSAMDKLETRVEGWLKPVPHLPSDAQKWIAENVWWLAIVSVVASVIGIFTIIGAIITYVTLFGAVSGFYATTQAYPGGWIAASLVSLLFIIATTVIITMSISPLQNRQKKGWKLLFMALVVSAISSIVGAVLSLSVGGFIFGIIFGALGVAIGAYFLFEIRSYFVASAKTTPPTVPPFTPAASK